jgi:hypothetical protein
LVEQKLVRPAESDFVSALHMPAFGGVRDTTAHSVGYGQNDVAEKLLLVSGSHREGQYQTGGGQAQTYWGAHVLKASCLRVNAIADSAGPHVVD